MKFFKLIASCLCILSLASCDINFGSNSGSGGNGGEVEVEKNKIDLSLFSVACWVPLFFVELSLGFATLFVGKAKNWVFARKTSFNDTL